MTAAETSKRFPQFILPDDWQALLEPNAGFVRPERAVLAHIQVARQHGAVIHQEEPVLEWKATRQGVTVRTARGTYSAGALVVCAGAWTAELLRGSVKSTATVPTLRPLRVPIAWLVPSTAVAIAQCTSPRMPVWYAEPADAAPVYGVPIAPDQGQPHGVKVAEHGGATARECDPRTVDRTCAAAELEHLRRAVERFVPCAAGKPSAGAVCLYTMSPDEHFIVDHWPGHSNVVVACGFSGHGFKFTPIIGQALADLATTGTTPLPTEFLKIARFQAD
jgi:sarcosine oxidase